jgi:tRNA pseudouridine13 synthase
MNPIDPPKLLGPSIGSASFKSTPEDFQVDEILGFEPSGDGEHCLIWVEKLDRNTSDVAASFADKLGIRKRLVSHCGLKDKNAITRQWFSLHLPGRESPTADELESDGVRVLRVTRNLRKLHRGTHAGNRFLVRLRDCTFSKDAAADRWKAIAERGVPNYFGHQRFGYDGRNVEQSLRLLAGETEVRDRTVRGLLISAARSVVFNACVGERVQRGSWDTPLVGEVFGFADNRSLILPANLRGDEEQRFQEGRLELTSPLWGEGDLASQLQVRELEQGVARQYPEITIGLTRFGLRQERRVIRLLPATPSLEWESESTLVLRFDLPKGTYATTLLREIADLDETRDD